MALVAQVQDGKLVDTSSDDSSTNKKVGAKSGMDKDSFLQLLVAQMKYQDPLQPTSNTEFIAQYAQFTQVETMQNMSAGMDLQRASALVGKEVYVTVQNSKGETQLLQGKVDYVVYENGKAYLSIGESLYSIDDLYTVADGEYMEAFKKATDLVNKLNKLPVVSNISIKTDGETIDKLKETYDKMTDYEKTFVAKEKVDALNKYVEKLDELRKLASNTTVKEWGESLGKLPSIDEITVEGNGKEIDALKAAYDKMNAYEKGLVPEDKLDTLNKYVAKLEELRKQGSGGNGGNGESGGSGE